MQTSRIEEVIGEFVQLRRAGSNLKGLSPFTDERTPSFVVSPAKQIFKCFSSQKGGSVVTFLMEKEHYSYPEALRWLARKYNIDIPEEQALTHEELAKISEKDSLFIVNSYARDVFVKNIHENEMGRAVGLSYFQERGFRADIIKKFELGYAMDEYDSFTQEAVKAGHKLDYLEKVGLTKRKEDKTYDLFRGRVMFPIHSATGRVLGFGGRILKTDAKAPKYVNSPESPIYHKSDILYGLYFAKGEIIKKDNCFLCEGYTDVISLYQAGLENVVSSSGTALTREQIRLVKRYTQTITILYDGDNAGIKASFRGIDMILEEGMNVRVVLFPDGEDPDSFARKNKGAELQNFIDANIQDFVRFKTKVLLKESESDPLQKAKLIKEIVQSIGLIPDPITRSVYVKEIADLFDMNEGLLTGEVSKFRAAEQHKQGLKANQDFDQPTSLSSEESIVPTTLEKDQESLRELREYRLVRMLIRYGNYVVETGHLGPEKEEQVETSVIELVCHELEKDQIQFENQLYQKVYEVFLNGLKDNTLFEASYFLKMPDQDIVKLVSEILSDAHEISPNWLAKQRMYTPTERDKINQLALEEIYLLKLLHIEQRLDQLQERIAQEPDSDEEINDILSEKIVLDRVRITLAQALNRVM